MSYYSEKKYAFPDSLKSILLIKKSILILLIKTFLINCPARADILKHVFLSMLIMVSPLERR